MLTVKYLVDFMEHARPEDLQEVLVGSGRSFADCPLTDLVKAGNLCLVDAEQPRKLYFKENEPFSAHRSRAPP